MNPLNASLASPLVRLGHDAAWAELLVDRSGFQREFVRLLADCPQLSGRVLDIGCGPRSPQALESLGSRYGTLDGVDPDPGVGGHPLLATRWQRTFESCAAPAAVYDLAYAYNVLEHISEPRPFFQKVHSVLKPGGVFWGLTPNAWHPFAALSRSIELLGLKSFARDQVGADQSGGMKVNDYPAYYRCNSPLAIARAVRRLGFRKVTFYFHPCLQWDTYFPHWLKWAPHAYDYLFGTRVPPAFLIFIVRLDK